MDTKSVIENMSRKPRLAICRYLALGAECAAKETALAQENDAELERTWPEVFDDYVFLQYLYETGADWERPTSHGQVVKTIRETVAAVEKSVPEARALLTHLMIDTRDGFRRMALEPDDWRDLSEDELLTRSAILHEMAKAADILELSAMGRGAGIKTDLSSFDLSPVFMTKEFPYDSSKPLSEKGVMADFHALSDKERSVARILAYFSLATIRKCRAEPEAGITPSFLEETAELDALFPLLEKVAEPKPDETPELEYLRLLVDREFSDALRQFRKRMVAKHALDRDFPLKRLFAAFAPWFMRSFDAEQAYAASIIWNGVFTPRLEEQAARYCFDGSRAERIADWILEGAEISDAHAIAAVHTVVNAVDFAVLTHERFADFRQSWEERYPRLPMKILFDTIRRSDVFLDRFDRFAPVLSDALLDEQTLASMIGTFPRSLRSLRQVGKKNRLPPPYALLHVYLPALTFFCEFKPFFTTETAELTGFPVSLMEKAYEAIEASSLKTFPNGIGPLLELLQREDALERFL